MRLSNNQIAGFVYTTADDNPGLRDRSHREGLIDTPEYEDLKAVIISAINEIETRRYKLRRRDDGIARERERSKGIFEAFSLRPLREVISVRYADDVELGRALDTAEEEVQQGVRQVQEVLSRFARLATLGTLVDVILHEGRTALARINYVLRRMAKLIEKTMPGDPESAEAMEAISKRFDEQAQALDRLFTQIEPLSGRRRGRPRRLSLQDVVRQGLAVIEGETEDARVHVEVGGNDQVVTVDPADIMQIVINLVRNAAYWTTQLPEPTARVVEVRTQREDDGTVDLIVSDNGPGVPEDVRDLIFDAYFTTKPDGVGLGLSIAGSIVKDFYGGELELLAEGPLPGATFRARLRRRTG
jgi:C4-dicarboxylate-specific signal transduction histidine kinase